jgi:hypothetical protein
MLCSHDMIILASRKLLSQPRPRNGIEKMEAPAAVGGTNRTGLNDNASTSTLGPGLYSSVAEDLGCNRDRLVTVRVTPVAARHRGGNVPALYESVREGCERPGSAKRHSVQYSGA